MNAPGQAASALFRQARGPLRDVAAFKRLLVNPTRGRQDLATALRRLRDQSEALGARWPVLTAWTLLLERRGRRDAACPSVGEIYDMVRAAPFRKNGGQERWADLEPHLVTAVWPDLEPLLPAEQLALPAIETKWFEEWRSAFLRARGTGSGTPQRADAIRDCDCMLNLVVQLFSAPAGGGPSASDAWFGILHEQAAAYARAERCRTRKQPGHRLVRPADLDDFDSARSLVASLAAVWRGRLDRPGVEGDALIAGLARRTAYLRREDGAFEERDGAILDGPGSAEARQEWIGLLLRYWAADDGVIEDLLARRKIVTVEDRKTFPTRPIAWVGGQELQVSLVGPSASGKTSLMFASEKLGHVEVSTAYLKLGAKETEDHRKIIAVAREKWETRKASNTEDDRFVARSPVKDQLCSFTFLDVGGERYFPLIRPASPTAADGQTVTEGVAPYTRKILAKRYENRPPSLVMVLADGAQPEQSTEDRRGFLNRLDLLIDVIDESPTSPETKDSRNEINASRPVYLLITHVDEMIDKIVAQCDQAFCEDTDAATEDEIADLQRVLTSEILRCDDLGLDFGIQERTSVLARLKKDRALLGSPPRLRVVLDAVDGIFDTAQRFAAKGLDNLHLLFLRPVGDRDTMDFPGVGVLWDHLWAQVAPASAKARRDALRNRLVTRLDDGLAEVEKLSTHAAKLDGLLRKTIDEKGAMNQAHAVKLAQSKSRVANKSEVPAKLEDVLASKDQKGLYGRVNPTQFEQYVEEVCRAVDMVDKAVADAVEDVLTIIGVPPRKKFSELDEMYFDIEKNQEPTQQEELRRILSEWQEQYRNEMSKPEKPGDLPKTLDQAEKLLNQVEERSIEDGGNDINEGLGVLRSLLKERKQVAEQTLPAAREAWFHAVEGVLFDTCAWRNRARKPENLSSVEKWIGDKENKNATIGSTLEGNFAHTDPDRSQKSWSEEILPAIRQLAGFDPALRTLHLSLSEIDRVKVYSYEKVFGEREFGTAAWKALSKLRELAEYLRRGKRLPARLRGLAALVVLKPLLEDMRFKAQVLFGTAALEDGKDDATNKGVKFNSLKEAEKELESAASEWKNFGFIKRVFSKSDVRNTWLGEIRKHVSGAQEKLESFSKADVRPVEMSASENQKECTEALNRVKFARIVIDHARTLGLGQCLRESGSDPAQAFGKEIERAQYLIGMSATALKELYHELNEILLRERWWYLEGSGLLSGHDEIRKRLGEVFKGQVDGNTLAGLDSFKERRAIFDDCVTALLRTDLGVV